MKTPVVVKHGRFEFQLLLLNEATASVTLPETTVKPPRAKVCHFLAGTGPLSF